MKYPGYVWQANVAWLYEQGVPPYVEQDYTAAERFYKLAAKQVRELEALPACSLACVLPAATPQAMFCEGAYTCWLGLC